MAPVKRKSGSLKKYSDEKNLLNESAFKITRGRGRPPKRKLIRTIDQIYCNMEFLKKVEPLSLDGNVAEKWRIFKRDFEIFGTAIELSKKAESVKVAIFLNAIGSEAVDVFFSFGLSTEDAAKYDTVVKAFNDFCEPKTNEVYETYKFNNRNQHIGEPFDNFLVDIKKMVRKCNFENNDRMVRDRIVMGTNDSQLQKRLLEVEKLDLEKTIDMARATEITAKRVTDMQKQGPSCSAALDLLTQKKDKYKEKQNGVYNVNRNSYSVENEIKANVSYKNNNNAYINKNVNRNNFAGRVIKNCRFCKQSHDYGKCPSFGKRCNNCGKLNHFAIACSTNKLSEIRVHPNDTIDGDVEDDDAYFIDSISGNCNNELNDDEFKSLKKKCWMQKIRVEDTLINFKLDTGAEVNVLPVSYLKYFKGIVINKFNKSLQGYGGNELEVIGKVTLICSCKNEIVNLNFLVVNTHSIPILGLPGCISLNLIERVDYLSNKSIDSEREKFINENHDLFEGLGCFVKDYDIVLKDGMNGSIKPARRIPLSLMGSVKKELNLMVKRGVISKNDGPTDFVSNLVVVEKKNGKLRLCIDPKDLNNAIKRENFPIPSFDEISEKLTGKKIFSVLDLKEGYWQVQLSEAASKLCTFSTPFGCYRFLRLPFGLSIAPEVFQKYNERNFQGIPGVVIYFDDVLIAAETKDEHDRILAEVVNRARHLNIRFNKEKFQFCSKKVNYLGQVVSEKGISCDPDRVRAINNLTPPRDKKDLQKLLGVVNYVREYVPNLAEIFHPLNCLLKKGVHFQWMQIHDDALSAAKKLICNAPTLKTFDVNKDVYIETDASKFGLGCCLMQEGRPIYFASRSLSETEVRYSQIEKEFLAVVYACNKFHYYIYGRQVAVKTDHKPLVSIMKKELNSIPSPRLQRMKLRLSKYSINLQYVPGKFLYIADLLSRYFDKNNKVSDIDDIDELVHSLNCSNNKKIEFQKETENDTVLKKLKNVIIEGWPRNKNCLDDELRVYYRMKDELYVDDGIIFLNERILVPSKMQKQILSHLHGPHLGIEKTKSRARSLLFWPQINRDIENTIVNCKVCQKNRSANVREPMLAHEIPNLPYQKLGIDIMFFQGKDFLIINDYYSRYLEILPIRNKTANEVCEKLKNCFSTHGIPREIVADNVPFGSYVFRSFCLRNDIKLTTTSPTYPQSNGFAEKSVQISKNMFKKCKESGTELWQALLEYRNTPLKECNASPVELLMSRQTRSLIPGNCNIYEPRIVPDIQKNILNNRDRQKHFYDRMSKYKNSFCKGELIFYKDLKKGWVEAKVKELHSSPRSYWIELMNGNVLRRNSNVLRKRQ